MTTLLLLLTLLTYQADDPKCATVYVYMPHHTWTSGRFSGKFYVNDERTVEISKNRYFVLRLPAGRHSFYVREKKLGGLVLTVKDTTVYYIKVLVDEGGFRVKFRGLSEVPKEEAEFAIKQSQPIRAKDVFNKTFVDMSIISP